MSFNIGPLSGDPKEHAKANARFIQDENMFWNKANARFIQDENLYWNKRHYWKDLGLTYYVTKRFAKRACLEDI